MSCTVIALPVLLYQAVSIAITASTINAIESNLAKQNTSNTSECEDVHIITAKHFIEKSFETVFMDKETLIKTLEEHGINNLKSEENGNITGQIDNYTLNFAKNSETEPYYLTIKCLESDNAEQKIEDLSEEYALNVQENTYLSIIEKLKDNNMEVEEEEVLDDNTIVLTVNLD